MSNSKGANNQETSLLPKLKSAPTTEIEKIDLEKLQTLAEHPEIVNSLVILSKTNHLIKMDAIKQYTKILASVACLGVGICFTAIDKDNSGLLIGGGLCGLGLSTNVITPGTLTVGEQKKRMMSHETTYQQLPSNAL